MQYPGDHLHIVKYLASTEHVQTFKKSELGLVQLASCYSSLEMIKYLTQTLNCDPSCFNSDPNAKGPSSDMPIHVAAFSGELDVLKYLIEHEHCDPNSADGHGNNVIQISSYYGYL